MSFSSYLSIGLLVLFGSALQGYANGTADALTVGIGFLFLGSGIVKLAFLSKESEQQAFLLTYAICIFVGGLAQVYSLSVFGVANNFIDGQTFFNMISPRPPFMTMADMSSNYNFPLAIAIWQQVYRLVWLFGLDFKPQIAIMFNALLMGFSASITVATARELFGNDLWRLRRVGILFASCGLFILFGAVLLRDCFTTIFNAMALWGMVRWLVRPVLGNFLFALATTGISACAMVYLRTASAVMFGFFAFLAFLFWLQRERFNPAVIIVALLVTCAMLIALPNITRFLSTSQAYQERYAESYVAKNEDTMGEDSLGMRLIMNQPLPIRLIVGSGFLMIFPMPLWAYVRADVQAYHLIKTWHGFYQVSIMPLVLIGFLAVFRLSKSDFKRAIPLMFLLVYLLLNWLAVVATTMEQRHLAQFMPALLILAVVADVREQKTGRELKKIMTWWFILVMLLHLAWVILKAM